MGQIVNNTENLLFDISNLINITKQNTAKIVNSNLLNLYWEIGRIIKTEIFKNEKADYGKSLIANLSLDLTKEFGRGYSQRNLFNMIKVYEVFNDYEILQSVTAKLSVTHIIELIKIDDEIKREFYLTMSANENWSVRVLKDRVNSMLFERTLISKKPDDTIINDLKLLKNENKMSTDLFFRDPYVLDFLGLKDTYSEKDLESAILHELEKFILEMGIDFAFMARQKRIMVDNEDYYIDLLFYHRKLRRLVVIELKLGKFKPEHKGQVELYLRWLEKYEKIDGENPPLAIVLCAEKRAETIELLELDKSGIHVAQFLTELPSKQLFESKLKQAIQSAKMRLLENDDKKYNLDGGMKDNETTI